MLLYKSIYGLKQASRLWNQHLDKVLGELEYHRLTMDFGVYIKGKGENRVLMEVYVDDIIMLAKLMQILNGLKGHMQLEFKMKDLGAANFILGIKIRWQEYRDIFMVLEKYAGDIFRKYNMYDN